MKLIGIKIPSQERGGRLHRAHRKVTQWKVSFFSDIDDIFKANNYQNSLAEP